MVSKMTSLDRKPKAKKATIVSKDGDVRQLRIDQETAMRKFRRRQRSISVKTVDSQRRSDPKIPGTNFPSKSSSPWNKHGNIKRPMNAFMLFGRAYRPVMVQMFPGAPNSQISIYLGNIWRSMTWEQQKPFFEEAKKIRYRHQNDYPEWLYERDNQRSVKYIKKLRENYMIPRNQVFFPGDNQTQTQLHPSISICAQDSHTVLNGTQEVMDFLPEINPTSNIIIPMQGGTGEMYNGNDLQILHTHAWAENLTSNNVDFTGYEHSISPSRDPGYEVSNEKDNVEGTIQFSDQASFDLQELWNLVEGNSPPTQNLNSQECAEALSLMRMYDYDVKDQTNNDGSTTSELEGQPSLDLQDLWNLVENSSPSPWTQIDHSQDCESCTWTDIPCENVVSVGTSSEKQSSAMVPMNHQIKYTVGPTSWPVALNDTRYHIIRNNEHLMETFPEHSVQFIVSSSQEIINTKDGDVLPEMNSDFVYADSEIYDKSCQAFCQAENVEKWWPISQCDPGSITE